MTYLFLYLGSCIGAYCAAWYYNGSKTWAHKPTKVDLVYGVIGALIWPIVFYAIRNDEDCSKERKE